MWGEGGEERVGYQYQLTNFDKVEQAQPLRLKVLNRTYWA